MEEASKHMITEILVEMMAAGVLGCNDGVKEFLLTDKSKKGNIQKVKSFTDAYNYVFQVRD